MAEVTGERIKLNGQDMMQDSVSTGEGSGRESPMYSDLQTMRNEFAADRVTET